MAEINCNCKCDCNGIVEIPRGFPFTITLPNMTGNFRIVLSQYRRKKVGIEGHPSIDSAGKYQVVWDEQQTLELKPKKWYNLEIWNEDNGTMHTEKIRFARALETHVGANGKVYYQ